MAKDQSHWLAKAILKHDHVAGAERMGLGLVRIERKDKPPALVGILTANPVDYAAVQAFLGMTERPDMVINIPTRAPWTHEAMRGLEAAGIAYGKMYDLYRALWREDDVSHYQNPEFYYAERLFAQDPHVIAWERISDRAYRLGLNAGEDRVIALTQAYEVTADEVRTVFAELKPFNILFKTNPYGRVSREAHQVAKRLGIQVVDAYTLGEALVP